MKPNAANDLNINGFKFLEHFTSNGFCVEVSGICILYSHDSNEECKRLFRFIVNQYLKGSLDAQGFKSPDNRNRLRTFYMKHEHHSKVVWMSKFKEVAIDLLPFKADIKINGAIELGSSIFNFGERLVTKIRK